MNTQRDNEEHLVISEVRALQYILQYPEHRHEFRPTMFTHKTACTLFECVDELHREGATIDMSSVAQRANKKDSRLGLKMVQDLLYPKTSPIFVEADRALLVNDLEAAETRARVMDELTELSEFIDAPTDLGEAFFNEMSSRIVKLQTEAAKRGHSKLVTLAGALDDYDEELERRMKGQLEPSGDLLLDKALVRKTAGGQIITIVGATGSAKSAYTLNLFNGLINIEEPTILVTLEMDTTSTLDRLAAIRLGINLEDLYKPEKLTPIRTRLKKETEAVRGSIGEIVDDPSLSLADLGALAAEYRTKHDIPQDKRIVMFVDLLTQVRDFATGPKGYSMAGSYEVAVNATNVLAKVHNLCIVATVQYNREVDSFRIDSFEDLQATRPHTINAIKNSHAIAERSRVVLSTWRPKYYADRYLPDAPETETMDDIMEVTVLKQSQGSVGARLNYLFEGSMTKLTPTAEGALPSFEESDDELDEVDQDVLRSVHF